MAANFDVDNEESKFCELLKSKLYEVYDPKVLHWDANVLALNA